MKSLFFSTAKEMEFGESPDRAVHLICPLHCRATEERLLNIETDLNAAQARLTQLDAEKAALQQRVDEKERALSERDATSQSSSEQVSALQEVRVLQRVVLVQCVSEAVQTTEMLNRICSR